LPSDLLLRRPDLVAAERRLASALERTHEARAALLPRISLTAAGGRSSSQLDDLLSSQVSLWGVAANAAQPLFQGGRLLANVDWTEARTREAAERYRQVVLRALGEVEDALAAERHLRQRELDLDEAVVQSQEALRLAEERYLLGLTDFVTLVEAQRSAFSAESQRIVIRRQLLDNRVNLHLALGGGFDFTAGEMLLSTR
jgi:outer membrane protein TolC